MNDARLRTVRVAFSFTAVAALGACGGGGGSSPPPAPPPPAPPPPAPMASSFAPSAAATTFVEGGSGQFSFTVSVTHPDSGTLVPVVASDSANVAQVGNVDTSVAGQYTMTFATAPGLLPGKYDGQISFKLCSDSVCTTTHTGGTQSLPYSLHVSLDDWKTFQRNAAHTGFANIRLDPTVFTTAWTWQRPAGDSEPIGGINAVATGDGKVFVTKDVYFGQAAVYALDEATGPQAWTYALGQMHSEGPAG
ncbi:MAG: hypothetical protein ABIR54_07480 [Burkholderiaceae bacterium]|jgi:hypothetical protein